MKRSSITGGPNQSRAWPQPAARQKWNHMSSQSTAYTMQPFMGVSTALLERRLPFRKHSGVRAAFHREFIKTGLLDVEWGKLYDQLFEDRQEGDYVALTSFDQDYVESQITRCRNFLIALQPLISVLSLEGGLKKP